MVVTIAETDSYMYILPCLEMLTHFSLDRIVVLASSTSIYIAIYLCETDDADC